MKIAVASDDQKTISVHFGRASGFMVFEIENNTILKQEYRENIGKSTGECHSCDHDTMIKNINDCDVVISYGMGQRIYADLTSHHILPIVTDEKTVSDAVHKFMKNELMNRTDKLH
ncbi:MAG TPA: NifB/NifX family molybdenum-iron cluster-binding protein [Candidatus Thermoplasmatota archaeon]|nr:NifB/NifX family molybdenum-iron cluster-binding protein [Candidatus Thermoplasmatota archaeon]